MQTTRRDPRTSEKATEGQLRTAASSALDTRPAQPGSGQRHPLTPPSPPVHILTKVG